MTEWIHRILGKKSSAEDVVDENESRTEMPYDADDVVARMLRGLQIRWKCQPIGRSGLQKDYGYTFQHGSFHFVTFSEKRRGLLNFFFFYEAQMSELHKVQTACNVMNQRSLEFKFNYTPHTEDNTLRIHLTTWMRLAPWSETLQEDFADLMMQCFEAAREFRQVFAELQKQMFDNPEEVAASTGRERWLAAELEMSRQTIDLHLHEPDALRLTDVLNLLTDAPLLRVKRLSAVTDRLEIIEEAEIIDHYDIGHLLTDGKAEDGFAREQATLIVEASVEEHDQTYVIHLCAEAEEEHALYLRMTLTQPDRALRPSHSLLPQSAATQRSLQWVVSIGRRTEKEKRAEFDYLWQEARDQREAGQELTQEGLYLMLSEEGDAAYNLYWGRRYYLEGRHYEALLHLENAHALLRRQLSRMSPKERDTFQEATYYAGLCALQLQMPHRAYYYLDSLGARKSLRYAKALVTALTASHDYRATEIISQSYSNLSHVLETPEMPDDKRSEIEAYLLFLRRQKARVLMDDGQLDEAESMLRELSQDDPRHERYILELLATIAQIRADQAPPPDRSTVSVSTEFPQRSE